MKFLFLIAALSVFLFLVACANDTDQIYEKSTEKSFANVIQDSEFAIIENNFRITNRLHIGDTIQKRGNTDFPQNEVILFCNLSIAEEMLKVEPRYINYCPYKITATELNGEVFITTRLLPNKTANKDMDKIAEKINNILRSIVKYAASEDPFILDQN